LFKLYLKKLHLYLFNAYQATNFAGLYQSISSIRYILAPVLSAKSISNVSLTDQLLKTGYTITTDKSLLDIEAIHHYLAYESYWAAGLSREKLQRSIENSICFGIYHENNTCGFARVITDKATFAYICDVFVLEPYRGKGLSKWLMQNIKEHPELNGLRRWSLATADAHNLYKQFGFAPVSKPDLWMEIFTPYVKSELP